MPLVTTWGSQDRVKTREAGPGAHNFIRIHEGEFWVSQARARLINSKQKEEGFYKLDTGVFQGAYKPQRYWETGESTDCKSSWESDIIFSCDSVGCYQGMAWHEKLVSKVPADHWPNKIDGCQGSNTMQ